MKRFIPYVFLLISSAYSASAYTPDSDGIYAVVDVTMRDPETSETVNEEIAIQLFYPETPVTCANFIGLAEGTLPWFDFEAREVRGGPDNLEPFYNGRFFHRLEANFVIQTGSPTNTNTGGPGWQIPDEAFPGLNHVGGGVVSMANGGTNTGGSQFFITLAQFPEGQARLDALNGKHTVFGIIREGIDVTQRIALAPVVGSRPVEGWEATINSITILRQGDAANAWDPSLYWISPTFAEHPIRTSNNREDVDDDPDTADVRFLKASWLRHKDYQYFLEGSNNLETWNLAQAPYARGVIPDDIILEERRKTDPDLKNPLLEDRLLQEVGIATDVLNDRRHFYRLLEARYPPLPTLEGKQLTIDFDPIEDTEDDFITFLPETLTVDFHDNLEGFWQMKRTDSATLKPIGDVVQYQVFPLAHRKQVFLGLDFFSSMQAYLNPNSEDPDTGSVYIYYANQRPEGSVVTGTYSMGVADEPHTPQNKNEIRITLTIVTTPANSNDPVTSTYTIDLWDNFSEASLAERFEGGYRVERSNTEFIQTGRLIYEWLEIDGETHLLIDFDLLNDMQVLLSSETSGSAEVFFRNLNTFESATFTSGPGAPRPNALDREGDKLVLTLDLQGQNTDPLQSTINIDFYDNFQGGYEATRTDSEVNQFGDVLEYQWFENEGETRVDITYDSIPGMQVYLTPQPTASGTTEGTAKVHYPQNGAVGEATFIYTVDGGNSRPETLDKNGTQLVLEFHEESLDLLTINILEEFSGQYNFTRQNSIARPSGALTTYDWFPRQDGTDLVFLDFDRLPSRQVILTYQGEGKTGGQAEVLSLDSGNVVTIPFTIGTAEGTPQSIDQAGKKLVVDLDTSTIDGLEVNFRDSAVGDWKRFFPDVAEPATGMVEEYGWFKYPNFDQVNVVYDFFLNTQIFLDYDTETTGKASVYFITSGNIEEGTFTITGADP